MSNNKRTPTWKKRLSHLMAASAIALLGAGVGTAALAQASSTLKFMVPFPAGGAADAMARVLVDKLREELKQTIVVENKPGASTRVAAEVLKNAPPDGNTVLMTLMDTMVIAPLVYSNLRYDPVKDFAPITEVASVVYGISVNANSPHRTVKDYLEAAKKDRHIASLGTTGLGSSLHFLATDLVKTSNVDISIVPFQGGPNLVTNLLGNQIGSAIDGMGVFIEQHRSNKVRVLAVSGKTRMTLLPDVPTLAESGFPTLVGDASYALFAPAGTPEAQIDRWNQAMRKVLASPEVRSRVLSIGYEPLQGSTPAEVTQLRERLSKHWQPIVKATGYRGD